MVLHQTAADLREEQEIADFLARKWDCTFHQIKGDLSPYDRMGMRNGSIVSFVEIKRRKVKKNTYPSIYVSVRKALDLMMAREAAAGLGHGKCAAVFVAALDDAIGFVILNRLTSMFNISLVGRTDRGLANDLEPCYLVPVEAFTWVGRAASWT